MDDLMTVVDWSRWQFALTAMYHWLFVPLTLGLSVIVGIMETIYYRTRNEKWLHTTKFWMTLFGINFAMGVATGIILEFEFGTNWSNYSWFVGDIFGAPLAIEGLLAFFMEATFIAVMFFGWKSQPRIPSRIDMADGTRSVNLRAVDSYRQRMDAISRRHGIRPRTDAQHHGQLLGRSAIACGNQQIFPCRV